MPPAICLSVLMPSAQSKKVLEKTGGTTVSQVVSKTYYEMTDCYRKNCARSIWAWNKTSMSSLRWFHSQSNI